MRNNLYVGGNVTIDFDRLESAQVLSAKDFKVLKEGYPDAPLQTMRIQGDKIAIGIVTMGVIKDQNIFWIPFTLAEEICTPVKKTT